jgi:type IV fimbrial biogenesis protein FimT
MTDMGTKQQGLTLIELMVTLAVAIILVTVGMPLFSGIVANNRATTGTNALVTSMKLARSEAVKRAETVVARSSGSDWDNGWLVFVDNNANGAADAGEEVLRNWEAPAESNITPSGGVLFVSFNATGENNGAQVGLELDPNPAGAAGPPRRCVTVAVTGQVRMKKDTETTWSCP